MTTEELWELAFERAAIMEIDGGLPAEEAGQLAGDIVFGPRTLVELEWLAADWH